MPRVRICDNTLNLPYEAGLDAYAVYDSVDRTLTFFRDRPNTYTNGQVIGTKTYYSGIETLSGNATPRWYSKNASIQTVVFEDFISPLTCRRWFADCSNLSEIYNIDLLDTRNVTTMAYMFYSCSSLLNADLSTFDTSNVTNMVSMFYFAGSADVASFDTSNVTNMMNMFGDCKASTIDVSGFDTSNVTNMSFMFSDADYITELDCSSFDTSNVNDVTYMFSYCDQLRTIYASNLFVVNNVDSRYMFSGSSSLVGGAGTVYNRYKVEGEYARIDNPPNSPGYFTAKGE